MHHLISGISHTTGASGSRDMKKSINKKWSASRQMSTICAHRCDCLLIYQFPLSYQVRLWKLLSAVCVFKGWLEQWHHGHMEVLGKVRIAEHSEAAHPRDRSTHAHSLIAEVSRLSFTGSGIAWGGSRNEAWSQNWATPQQENVKSHLAALKIINHHLYYLLEPAHTHPRKKNWRSQECALFPQFTSTWKNSWNILMMHLNLYFSFLTPDDLVYP